MPRMTTLVVATLAAVAAASLASTAASAHFSGGGGGFSGAFSSAAGHISASGGYTHLPVAASGIARSSAIARIPVASGKTNRRIPRTTVISQLPKTPVTIQDPNHGNPKPPKGGGGLGGGVAVGVVGGVVGVVGGVVGDTTGPNGQAVQPAQANCNCLTKRYLSDGSVLFQDICSRESALATPADPKTQAQVLTR